MAVRPIVQKKMMCALFWWLFRVKYWWDWVCSLQLMAVVMVMWCLSPRCTCTTRTIQYKTAVLPALPTIWTTRTTCAGVPVFQQHIYLWMKLLFSLCRHWSCHLWDLYCCTVYVRVLRVHHHSTTNLQS